METNLQIQNPQNNLQIKQANLGINQSNQQIKQPIPNIQTNSINQNSQNNETNITKENNNSKEKYKIIKPPHVGEIIVPKISKTPLCDTIELRKKETPKIKYKSNTKKTSLLSIHSMAFLTTITCSIIALTGLIKKH